MAVDWSERGGYIVAKHQLTPAQADEALADTDRVVIDPDYNSKSGRSIRTIGESPSAGVVLTVITITDEGITYGVNAWRSNDRDLRIYRQSQGG